MADRGGLADNSEGDSMSGKFAAGVVSVALGIVLMGVLPGSAMAESCPNAALRFGPSVNLPDCRAYELVTPRIKGDNSSFAKIRGFADGEHVMFESILPLPGAQSGQFEMGVSSRTPSGWVTTSLAMPAGSGEPFGLNGGRSAPLGTGLDLLSTVSFTSDFSAAFIDAPFQYGELDQNKHWNTFRIGIPSGAASIESLPDGGAMTEELIDPPNFYSTSTFFREAFFPGAFLAGNSSDGSRVFFETTVKLPVAAGSPQDTHGSGNEIFERHDGHTYLVGVLPDHSVAACGAELGLDGMTQFVFSEQEGVISAYGSVSRDGTNIVFNSPSPFSEGCPEAAKTYLRIDNGQSDARTIELPGRFLSRTADQQKLFLTGEGDIYEYDIASGQNTIVGKLGGGLGSALIGSSTDGSRVYSTPGSYVAGGHLSLFENGVVKQLPIPSSGALPLTGTVDSLLPHAQSYNRPAVSSDGSRLVFVDTENLTNYDSKGHHEVYMYNATTNKITCLSCNPDGASPQNDSGLLAGESIHSYLGNGGTENEQAKNLLVNNVFTENMYPAVSNDDRHVFFDSREGLVPQDTNGIEDVYEWEQAGTGTCGISNTNYSMVSGGCVYLISSGSGSNGSWIVGAGEDGGNVLFVSNDSLTPQVDESAREIYDARIDGGFPFAEPVYGCDSGQCQGPQTPAPLLLAPPPSATFVGVGNPVPETITVNSKTKKPVKHKKRKHGKKHRKTAKHAGNGRK
jgi:hypothetical protein